MLLNKEVYLRLGKLGEERVAAHLRAKGYIIVKRNWRDRYGEIDIIAEKGNTLVFVEVKTRDENAVVTGVQAIDSKKIRHIQNCAQMFANRFNGNPDIRFDVAEVVVFETADNSYAWRLNYIENAF